MREAYKQEYVKVKKRCVNKLCARRGIYYQRRHTTTNTAAQQRLTTQHTERQTHTKKQKTSAESSDGGDYTHGQSTQTEYTVRQNRRTYTTDKDRSIRINKINFGDNVKGEYNVTMDGKNGDIDLDTLLNLIHQGQLFERLKRRNQQWIIKN